VRILVAHSRYLSGAVSGENRVVEDEAKLLRDSGHDVEMWTPSVEDGSGSVMIRNGVEAVWSRRAARTMRSLIRDHAPDVVHVHNLYPALSPSVLRATGDVPIVQTLHSYRLLCLPATFLRNGRVCEDCLGHVPWRGVVHGCYRGSVPASAAIATSLAAHRAARTFDRPTMYLAVSRFVRDKHVAGGLPAARIRVKPNFSWPSPRREGPGEYFLFLGRLSEEKGLPTMLRAMRSLNGARLVVAGDGPERARMEAEAPAGVEFLGAIEPDAVPDVVRRARALVVPSACFEGAPRSILEAYSAGVPVIASAIGGLPEVVDNDRTGVLVPLGDVRKWEEAAERLLDDAEATRLGQGAWQAWQKHFGPDQALRNLEQAYREALGIASDAHVHERAADAAEVIG